MYPTNPPMPAPSPPPQGLSATTATILTGISLSIITGICYIVSYVMLGQNHTAGLACANSWAYQLGEQNDPKMYVVLTQAEAERICLSEGGLIGELTVHPALTVFVTTAIVAGLTFLLYRFVYRLRLRTRIPHSQPQPPMPHWPAPGHPDTQSPAAGYPTATTASWPTTDPYSGGRPASGPHQLTPVNWPNAGGNTGQFGPPPSTPPTAPTPGGQNTGQWGALGSGRPYPPPPTQQPYPAPPAEPPGRQDTKDLNDQ